LEICPVGFVFGGRMGGLTFLLSVSYCAISYCNPDLTPSSVTISNQDYLVLAVTTQSPTCGRDDRALWFPPLRLLCYSHTVSLVYVSEPKAPVPILRPRKRSPTDGDCANAASLCLLLHSPLAYTNQPQAPAVTKDYRYQISC